MLTTRRLCIFTVEKLKIQFSVRRNDNCIHPGSVRPVLHNWTMILSGFQLCFVVFLASFPCARAEGSSHESQYNGNGTLKDSNGFSNHTRCSWNCTVLYSNLTEQRRTAFAQNRLIAFGYLKMMDEKCVKQTSRNSIGSDIEFFKVLLLANNKLSSFDQAMQISTDLIRMCPHSKELIKGAVSWEIDGRYHDFWPKFPKFKL